MRSGIRVLGICLAISGNLGGFGATLRAQEENEKPIVPAEVKLDRPVDFERDIYPILDSKCIACHNLAIAENKLNLEDLESIMKGGTSGPAVVPKEPDKSLLYQLAARSEEPVMPPMPNDVDAEPLTPQELGLIRQWIIEGAAAGSGRQRMQVQWGQLPDDLNPIYGLALSADQRTVVATRANQVFVYHLPSGQTVQRLVDNALEKIRTADDKPFYPHGAAHRDFVHSVAIHPSGNLIATGGYRNVKLWERSSELKLRDIPDVGQVGALAVDPTGAWVAAATDNHRITLWNQQTGERGKVFEGHTATIQALAFTPSAAELGQARNLVAVTAADLKSAQRALIAAQQAHSDLSARPDAQSEALAEELKKRSDAVTTSKTALETAQAANEAAIQNLDKLNAAIAAGVRLVSVADDKTLKVWNTANGQLDWEAAAPEEFKSVMVLPGGTQVLTGGASGKISLWERDAEAEGGVKLIREYAGHSKPVNGLQLVLPAAQQFVSASEDGTARVWTIANGQAVRTLNHGAGLVGLAIRPDGGVVATAAVNGTLRLWNLADGKQLIETRGAVDAIQVAAALTDDVTVAKQLVALADARMKEADKTLKEREETLKKSEEAVTKGEEELKKAQEKTAAAQKTLDEASQAAADKADDKALAKKVEDAQKALDTAKSEQESAQRTLDSAKRSVGLAKESLEAGKAELASRTSEKEASEAAQKDLEARLAEAKTAETEAAKPLRALSFSGDGRLLATSSELAGIQLWDGYTGLGVRSLLQPHAVGLLAFEGTNLVAAGADGSLAVFDADPEWKLAAVLGPAGDDPLDVTQSRFTDRVLALDFSRDGRYLATGGGEPSRSGELLLWDVAQRSVAREFVDAHSDTVFGIEFSRDGKQLLSGAADKFVKVFDVESGNHVKSFEGHTHHVMDVSWQADGSVVASAGADNAIKVWNVDTGEQKRTISNYQKQVTSLQFVGTTEFIVSCGGDKTVRLHRTSNGQNVRTFSGAEDYVYAVAVSGDQSAVVAGGEDGVVRVWNGQNGQPMATIDTSRGD